MLIAIAMIALILMQRGAGAQAGSGFGGGASATVFGFAGVELPQQSTKWLAIAFFVRSSIGMAVYASKKTARQGTVDARPDLGVMGHRAGPGARRARCHDPGALAQPAARRRTGSAAVPAPHRLAISSRPCAGQ